MRLGYKIFSPIILVLIFGIHSCAQKTQDSETDKYVNDTLSISYKLPKGIVFQDVSHINRMIHSYSKMKPEMAKGSFEYLFKSADTLSDSPKELSLYVQKKSALKSVLTLDDYLSNSLSELKSSYEFNQNIVEENVNDIKFKQLLGTSINEEMPNVVLLVSELDEYFMTLIIAYNEPYSNVELMLRGLELQK